MALSTSLPHPVRHAVLAAILLALVPAALFLHRPADADARSVWCAGDPAIIVNGSVVSITAHMPLDRLRDIDHVEFVFHVPSNANVTAVINDSVLFRAEIKVVKDLAPTSSWSLLSGTPVHVDMRVHHDGPTFDYRATTLAVGWGTNLWQYAESDEMLTIKTKGALNLRLW